MSTLLSFPRRQLGLQDLQTDKSEQLSVSRLAIIAIANLIPGDQLSLPKGTLRITANTAENIQYTFTTKSGAVFQECILPEQLANSALFAAFCHQIPTLSPAYTDPLCQVLERDPAVYRLRTQQGWVINDALSKMTGNVQYPRGPGVGLRTVPPEEILTPVTSEAAMCDVDALTFTLPSQPGVNEASPAPVQTTKTSAPAGGSLQGSFDF